MELALLPVSSSYLTLVGGLVGMIWRTLLRFGGGRRVCDRRGDWLEGYRVGDWLLFLNHFWGWDTSSKDLGGCSCL